MAIYEILFNVDSIQALQCEIFSYVYELNLYSVYSWQIIILLELSRHPIELSIKLIVLSILFYSILIITGKPQTLARNMSRMQGQILICFFTCLTFVFSSSVTCEN